MVFIVFLAVFVAMIEIARGLNILVTLNSIVYLAAGQSAADENPLLVYRAADVKDAVEKEIKRYGYLDVSKAVIFIDMNHLEKSPDGSTEVFFTRVFVKYSMGPLFFPGFNWNVTAIAHRMNRLQGYRLP